MYRRDFLFASSAGLFSSVLPDFLIKHPHTPIECGWNPVPRQIVRQYIRRTPKPYLMQQARGQFIGSGQGRIVLLHKYLSKALGGKIVPHDQEGLDCVGQAYGRAVDTLAAVQIHALGLPEKFEAEASTEAIYGGSKYEIGYTVHGDRSIIRVGGSWGRYASQYLRDYGVLVRKQYGDIDLTSYDIGLANNWGRNGIPDELEPIAKLHPVRSFALVRSYAECRDAIVNGYPVVLCSNYGFNPKCRRCNPAGGRDDQGFLNRCGYWNHAMLAIAVDDTDRPGVLVVNSWGSKWVSGPRRLLQPEGSFWCDAENIDGMCAQNDSFAISGFLGFPTNPIIPDYRLF